MIRVLLTAALGSLILASAAGAADNKSSADSLVGKWWFPKKNGKMEIYREGDKFLGKVISYEKPEQLDDNNPDESLRSRKFVGILMMQDFVYDADDAQWTDGTIYDADSGKTYSCNMWYKDGDPQVLNVRGYVGISILGRTEIFTRVTAEDEAAEAAQLAEAEKAKDAPPPDEEKGAE